MSLSTFSLISALRTKSILVFLISLYGILVLFFEQTCVLKGLSPILKTDRLNGVDAVYFSKGGADSLSVEVSDNPERINGFEVNCTLVESINYKELRHSQKFTKVILREIEGEKWAYNYTFTNDELFYPNVLRDRKVFYSLDSEGEFEFNAVLNLKSKTPCFMSAKMSARKEVCRLPINFSFNYFVFTCSVVLFYCLMCGLSHIEKNVIRKMMLELHSLFGDISGFEFCNEYTKKWTKYAREPHYIRAFSDLLDGKGLNTAFISGKFYKVLKNEVFISDGIEPKMIELRITEDQRRNLLKYIRVLNMSNKNSFQSNGHSHSLEEVINFYNSDQQFYICCEENFTGEAKTPGIVRRTTFNDLVKSCPKKDTKVIYIVHEHFRLFVENVGHKKDVCSLARSYPLIPMDGGFFLTKVLMEGFKMNPHNRPGMFKSSQWKMYLSDIWKISEIYRLGVRRPPEMRKNTKSLDIVLAMTDSEILSDISQLAPKAPDREPGVLESLDCIEFVFDPSSPDQEVPCTANKKLKPVKEAGREGKSRMSSQKEGGRGKPTKDAVHSTNFNYLLGMDHVYNQVTGVLSEVSSFIESFNNEKSKRVEELKSEKNAAHAEKMKEIRETMRFMSKKEIKKMTMKMKLSVPPDEQEPEPVDLSQFEEMPDIKGMVKKKFGAITKMEPYTYEDKEEKGRRKRERSVVGIDRPEGDNKGPKEVAGGETSTASVGQGLKKLCRFGNEGLKFGGILNYDYSTRENLGRSGVSEGFMNAVERVIELKMIVKNNELRTKIGLSPALRINMVIAKGNALKSIDYLNSLQIIDLIYLYKFLLLITGGQPDSSISPSLERASQNLTPGPFFIPLISLDDPNDKSEGSMEERAPSDQKLLDEPNSKGIVVSGRYKDMPLSEAFNTVNNSIKEKQLKRMKYYKTKALENSKSKGGVKGKKGKGNFKKSEISHLERMEKGVKVASFLLSIYTIKSGKCFSKNKVLMREKGELNGRHYRCSNGLVKMYTKAIIEKNMIGDGGKGGGSEGKTDRFGWLKSRLLSKISYLIRSIAN